MSKSLKKIVEESRDKNLPEVEMCDRGITNMLDIPGLFTLSNITQLVLSHNKLTAVPANISELKNLEVLNMFNNQIEELPTQISSLQKLKHLNLSMNRLNSLPRGFGSLPALEVLDLTYNNLSQNSLPGNFFYLSNLDLTGPKQVFKAENNPWVTPIADQFQLGVSHVFEYVRSETYKYLYGRHMQANPEPPKKSNDKSKKISRKPLATKNK
ncbi:hypothetical protein PAMP_011528 [Pampus punctatissimus]